jgi:hypothetical protein
MSTKKLPGSTGRPARDADNLTAICEPTVYKMWETRSLTALWAIPGLEHQPLCRPTRSLSPYRLSYRGSSTMRYKLLLEECRELWVLRVFLKLFSKLHSNTSRTYLLMMTRWHLKYLPETERKTALRLLLYYAGSEDCHSGCYKE